MTGKKVLIYVLIRLAFLIALILLSILLVYLTYDPHKLCQGGEHRHTMGPVGYVLLPAMITVVWFLAIIFELMVRIFSDKRKAFALIFVIIFIIILFMFFI